MAFCHKYLRRDISVCLENQLNFELEIPIVPANAVLQGNKVNQG